MRRNAAWPMVLPSWPTSRWPSQPKRIQPMPQESPSTYLSGTSAWNSVIAAALGRRQHPGAVGGEAAGQVHPGEREDVGGGSS